MLCMLFYMYGTEMVKVMPLMRSVASVSKSQFTNCHQQGHDGSKILLQQSPPVLNGEGGGAG